MNLNPSGFRIILPVIMPDLTDTFPYRISSGFLSPDNPDSFINISVLQLTCRINMIPAKPVRIRRVASHVILFHFFIPLDIRGTLIKIHQPSLILSEISTTNPAYRRPHTTPLFTFILLQLFPSCYPHIFALYGGMADKHDIIPDRYDGIPCNSHFNMYLNLITVNHIVKIHLFIHRRA